MLVAGIVISVIGLFVVLAGLLQKGKAKKILAAPFKKTGEVAANPQVADAKGMISCEGAVQTQQPVIAPCSNQQCVYYELKVEKHVEESKMTDRGMQTSRTWKTVSEQKQGSYFQLNDGSGPVGVDCREGLDADLKQSYSGAPPGGQGLGILANLVTGAIFGGNERIVGYRATERILPAQGNLFVMGQLKGGQITKPEGMMGKLIVSPKGRDGLVGAVNRLALILWIVGGLVVVGGIPVMFMNGPKSNPCKPDHAKLENDLKEACTGAMKTAEESFDWKITKAGVYEVNFSQPKDAKVNSWPTIIVETEDKWPMNNPFNLGLSDSKVKVNLPKGDYKLRIYGVDGSRLEGGFRYILDVKYLKPLGKDDKVKASKGEDDDKASDDDDDKSDKKADKKKKKGDDEDDK